LRPETATPADLRQALLFLVQFKLASQKLANCGVTANALAASTYPSTPHCSTFARLAAGAFCLASHSFAFLRSINQDALAKTDWMAKQKFRPTRPGGFSGAKAYIR
jgi:hypothetical protein